MIDFQKLVAYQSAMSQAKNMFQKGIISKDDIVSIENKLAVKYGLHFGSIYRETGLINLAFRANIKVG